MATYISLPIHSPAQHSAHKIDITQEERLHAFASTQSGKTPGADGLPAGYNKQYGKTLTYSCFPNQSSSPSMMEAVIVVIHKAGKDPNSCSSYHPISLLNAGAKI